MHWQTASADHIASLVDLSASEVRELLGEESGSTAAELAEKVAAMVSRCEAMLTAGLYAYHAWFHIEDEDLSQ